MSSLCVDPNNIEFGINAVWKCMKDVAGCTSTIWRSECGEFVVKLVARQSQPWIEYVDLYEREICALEKLNELGIERVPRIVAKNDEQKAFVMTYCGTPLSANNAPQDVRKQLTSIISSISEHQIQHNDLLSLKLQQILVKNDLLYICDWGWASLQGRFDWGIGLRNDGIRNILGERLSTATNKYIDI